MKPLEVEVFSPLPEGWRLCTPCETLMPQAGAGKPVFNRSFEELPPEWQTDISRLSDLVYGLAERYGDAIRIRITDPRSLQGLIKSIRYNVHRYPAFVIANGEKVIRWDIEALYKALHKAGIMIHKAT